MSTTGRVFVCLDVKLRSLGGKVGTVIDLIQHMQGGTKSEPHTSKTLEVLATVVQSRTLVNTETLFMEWLTGSQRR